MQQHVEIDGETQKTMAEALFHRHAPAIFAYLWNTQTGTEVFAFKTFQGWSDGPSAWSSDGKYVLMSAFVGTSNVNLWKPTPPRSRASFYEVIWIA